MQLSEPYLKSSNDDIKKAAFSYYLQKLPTNKLLKTIPVIYNQALENETQEIRNIALHALTRRKELWALRIVEKVILDTHEMDAIRLELIREYKHPFQKKHVMLLKIARNINDPIRFQSMELLTRFDTEPTVINLFKNTVANSETQDTHRLMLLKKLSKTHPDWVLDFLINQLSQ